MEANETRQEKTAAPDLRAVVRGVIDEFVEAQRQKAEPAYKAELVEQRRRREQLETRVNALIRAELQRLGVSKVDLAFRAVRDDVVRGEDGRLVARGPQGEVGLKDFLTNFVNENPELLPARISGGSGMTPAQKSGPAPSGFDLDKIRPGMNPEELERVRQEISRLASQTLRGL